MFFSITDNTTESSQDTYHTIGAIPWDKVEIKNHILKAEKMQTFLSIKLTPQIYVALRKYYRKNNPSLPAHKLVCIHIPTHTDCKSAEIAFRFALTQQDLQTP